MSETLKQSFDAIFGKLEHYAASKTVVGDPITFGNVIIVPLVDVTLGAGAGAGNKGGGGGGLGAKISPSAVLVVVNDTVQLVNVKDQDSINKLIDMVPGIVSKLGGFFKEKSREPGTENPDS
ncbi:MAG: sporulation protein [Clostridiales bacterium]|jgi:uncharacterized spore protein YtfJ|nr:sporulation protein [Clostridiales bacterium]